MCTVILLAQFPEDLVAGLDCAGLRRTIHLFPYARKHVRRVITNPRIQKRTGVNAIWHVLSSDGKPRIVPLHLGKVFESDLEIVRNIAGRYAFAIEAFDHQTSE